MADTLTSERTDARRRERGEAPTQAIPSVTSGNRDLEDRGSLDLAERVVNKVAQVAASRTPGVVRTKHSLGRSLPSASCEVAGDQVRVDVNVASRWPLSSADVARDVRERVSADVERLTGLRATKVRVLVSEVAGGAAPTRGTASRPSGKGVVAANEATGPGKVAAVGPVLALLVGGLATVLLHDGIATLRDSSSTWLGSAGSAIADLGRPWWFIPVGLVVAALGLWLLSTALRRRTRSTLALKDAPATHLELNGLARLAGAAARECDGVTSAKVKATRKVVRVEVASLGAAGVEAAVTEAVESSLSALASPPRTKVLVHTPAGEEKPEAAQ